MTGKNVLIISGSLEETANHFNLTVPVTTELLSQARKQLAQVRMNRPKPQRDNKIVTSWNGTYICMYILYTRLSYHNGYFTRFGNISFCTRISSFE